MPKEKKTNSTDKKVSVSTDKKSPDFLFSQSNDLINENEIFSGEGQLSCDVFEEKDNIVVRSTIAGIDPQNLDVSVSNDLLTIRGFREMNEEIDESDFYCREIYWGSFSRSIVLPQEVDQKKVQAILKNGVLTIRLPKKYKTTSIEIKHLDD
ncbi:MAG TPA: Hsp20/alpha crystallin family protein [Patescibacteria group bacterium]|nr:Hsp20/alpha crystallin family protein [Patescibacteria group bacterium]